MRAAAFSRHQQHHQLQEYSRAAPMITENQSAAACGTACFAAAAGLQQ
jgi:hypothetical protein